MNFSFISRSAALAVFLLVLQAAVCAAAENLLRNPGAEDGLSQPGAWLPFAAAPAGVHLSWEENVVNSGRRSLGIEVLGPGFGLWQQTVPVAQGQVYLLTGHVAFQGIAEPDSCHLQIVFRDAAGVAISTADFPGHSGTRWFALDFPAKLKVRAPAGAAVADVNCILRSTGRAWFDDLFFGAAPAGRITGTVTSAGLPLPGARVFILSDPWGQRLEAVTGLDGSYVIDNVPSAFPRYILQAEALGHRSQVKGKVHVAEGVSAAVDFNLLTGKNPADDLRVKFGSIGLVRIAPSPTVPNGAAPPTDASGYPAEVFPYLAPDACITSDHPAVKDRAEKILASLDPQLRRDTYSIAWAVYAWVAQHIEHDGVFFHLPTGGMRQPYKDVTSGIWQTIGDEGWGVGKNIYDWAYRPHELLQIGSGICIEHAWLITALLRALNIPARALLGSLEFWAQDSAMNGVWIGISPTAGRVGYREKGLLNDGFEIVVPTHFSVLSRPMLRADWNAQNAGLWRETHPWEEDYEGSEAGRRQAAADLAAFASSGEAPLPKEIADSGTPPEKICKIYYSDVRINLYNMTEQRFLDVRFPLVTDTAKHWATGDHAYWTNHPGSVVTTWIEEIANHPVAESERWFHILFDLSPLLH
uniref:carboxypeptidase regulatory-like domain-containing protein n=1 Tax=Candidatus Electronema sp. TaxID=2698783 RepID=UPI004057A261